MVGFWFTIIGSTTNGVVKKIVFTACKNLPRRKPQLVPLFIRTTPQVVEITLVVWLVFSLNARIISSAYELNHQYVILVILVILLLFLGMRAFIYYYQKLN